VIELLTSEQIASLQIADVGVIGAGPSGLTLGLFLDKKICIYEKDDIAGGHARSIKEGPWTFDRGPHILFSRDKKILEWMTKGLQENVHTCTRNNKVIIDNTYLHYPIENDLGSLEAELRTACLISYVQAQISKNTQSHNLDDWFRNNFGDELTDLYFKPYNEKIWKVPLRELSMTWSDRIPNPPISDVIKGALGIRTEGYLHQLHYQYPLEGGFQALSDKWYEEIKESVSLNVEINQISIVEDAILLETSEQSRVHDWIVYTGYLDHLPKLCNFTIPSEVENDIHNLRVNGISCVTIGVKGEDLNNFTALYVPDPRYLFNRISFPKVFSPKNAPDGCFLIQAEITTPPGAGPISEEIIFEQLENFCTEMGIIENVQQIIYKNFTFFSHAYVVYDEGFEERISNIFKFFASKNILLHGRFGSFQYINTDMCVLESAKLASLINQTSDPYECLTN